MVEIAPVHADEVPAVAELRSQRLEDTAVESVREWRREHPGLVVGAYADGELVGFATGDDGYGDCAHLNGIGVRKSHTCRGIGSALLDRFEAEAAAAGFPCVSLGSAGGYVDEFYLANGYEAESVLVRLDPDDVPADYADRGYEIVEERLDEGFRKLYVGVDEHDFDFVESVREDFDDPEAIYIMRKTL